MAYRHDERREPASIPLHRLVRILIFLTMKAMKSMKGQRTKLDAELDPVRKLTELHSSCPSCSSWCHSSGLFFVRTHNSGLRNPQNEQAFPDYD